MAAEGDDRVGWRTTHSLLEGLVRPGLVVVIEELAEHPLQVLPAQNQQVVQVLSASGPHPAFSERGVGLQLQLIGTIGGYFESSIRSIRWLVESSNCSTTSTPGASNSVCSIEKLGASGHVRCRLLGLT